MENKRDTYDRGYGLGNAILTELHSVTIDSEGNIKDKPSYVYLTGLLAAIKDCKEEIKTKIDRADFFCLDEFEEENSHTFLQPREIELMTEAKPHLPKGTRGYKQLFFLWYNELHMLGDKVDGDEYKFVPGKGWELI